MPSSPPPSGACPPPLHRPLARRRRDYAGGKGANLGELTGAGVPVPPGFVVGAPAYAAFCDEGGLRDRIDERLLDGLDVDDTEALEAASARVRAMVEAEPVPDFARGSDRPRPTARWPARRVDGRRGAILRDRRGHRVRLVRRDERDVPQRPRRGGRHRRRAPLLGVAVRLADRLLPRQARLLTRRHGHRRGRAAADRVARAPA